MEVIDRGLKEFEKVKSELTNKDREQRPFMLIPIPVRWAQFVATFRKSAVIETKMGMSIVHAYYKPVNNIIGVYKRKRDLGRHLKAEDLLSCMAMTDRCILIKETRDSSQGQSRFGVKEVVRETSKAYFHSSAGIFRRRADVDEALSQLMQRVGIHNFEPNTL